MTNSFRKMPASASDRMNDYRARLRKAGLRQVQMWLPDTRSASFAKACAKQSKAIASGDAPGRAIDEFIDANYEWPAR